MRKIDSKRKCKKRVTEEGKGNNGEERREYRRKEDGIEMKERNGRERQTERRRQREYKERTERRLIKKRKSDREIGE